MSTCGSVQEKTLKEGDLMSLKLWATFTWCVSRDVVGVVNCERWYAALQLGVTNPALLSSSSFCISSLFVDGLYQSLNCWSAFSEFIQFKVDSRVSSLLLIFEDSFVKFSWNLSEDILKVFTIWRACFDLSQLRERWTLSLKARGTCLWWRGRCWFDTCSFADTLSGDSSYLKFDDNYISNKKYIGYL